MTEVTLEDGSKVETSLPAERVEDLQAKPAVQPEPAKVAEPSKQPAEPKAEEKPEPAKQAEKPAEQQQADPEAGKPRKVSPIAKLLDQRHQLETDLATEREAKATLEAKVAELSAQPKTQATADAIGELAKKYNVQPDFLKEVVDAVRQSVQPQQALPAEVQQLIAESQQRKAVEAETAAFNNRVEKLAAVIKGEPIADHREKLMELAYSTEKAPDGERYCDKELSELYFGFIKPEVEPGRPSAEPSRKAPARTEVTDFEQIQQRDDPRDIESMDDATFSKYSAWLREKAGDVPIRNARG